jgi:hydroxypyruvate reductase
MDLVRTSTERDVVVCLISGGASALLCQPREGLTLEDLQHVTRALLKSGATINELNAVRKHLDTVKGGELARLAQPSQVVSLILSDVVGNPLDVIASGPTAPDPTTYVEAIAVVERYKLRRLLPARVCQLLQAGAEGRLAETPKPGDPLFTNVLNLVVGSNQQAAAAAAAEAERLGLHVLLLSTYIEGEAREVGKVLAGLAREMVATNRPLPRPACVIAGGETTVTVRGDGLGGRNQELALGAATRLAGLQDVLVVGLATDGADGPTDAAGALADGTTLARAATQGLDPDAALANNDAYRFFEPLGDLLKLGPTRTNVNDLMLVFAF